MLAVVVSAKPHHDVARGRREFLPHKLIAGDFSKVQRLLRLHRRDLCKQEYNAGEKQPSFHDHLPNIYRSDLLPTVAIIIAGVIIVDLPTWFDHEKPKSNGSPDYHCEHDKKHFHDGILPK